MDVSAFLAENAKKIDKTEFIVSERFKDKHGKPVPWVLAPVSCSVDNAIKKRCTHGREFDNLSYSVELTVASVLEPNLANAELQDSYHVYGKRQLLETMLTAGEFNAMTLKALEINGMAKPMQELIDDAKNA